MRYLATKTGTLALIFCVVTAACSGQRTTSRAGQTRVSRPQDRNETTRIRSDVSQDAGEGRKQSPATRKATRCQQNLNRRVQTLQRRMAVLKREMDLRQKREREKAVTRVRDPQAISEATEYRDAVRSAIARLSSDPLVLAVELQRVLIDESTGRLAGSAAGGTPIVVINRQNWRAVLAVAERQCSAARNGTWVVPDSIQDRHKRETLRYEELGSGSLARTKALVREAGEAVRAAADKPDSLDAAITQWERQVDVAVAEVYDEIEALRTGHSSTAPVRPTGFLIIAAPFQDKAGSGHTQTLVVVMTIRSESFVPTEEAYQGLLQTHRDLPPMEERQRIWVLDPREFKMILRGGRAVSAEGVFQSETWGGDVLVNEPGRCIVRYGAECPRQVSIRLAWELDPKDCAGRLQLQFADSEAVEVPSCRLEPGVSESTSAGQ
ncbi:MAG: hypothetical protein JW955_21280 [Sedimentisphaerales bacterium]|nr:hypothetical protein [Sedimentisphaerales bacterium]